MLDAKEITIDGPGEYLYVMGQTSIFTPLGTDNFIAKVSIQQRVLVKLSMQGCLSSDTGLSLTFDRFGTSLYSLSTHSCFSTNSELSVSHLTRDLTVRWSRLYGITGTS